jgi:hypothetical protein
MGQMINTNFCLGKIKRSLDWVGELDGRVIDREETWWKGWNGFVWLSLRTGDALLRISNEPWVVLQEMRSAH